MEEADTATGSVCVWFSCHTAAEQFPSLLTDPVFEPSGTSFHRMSADTFGSVPGATADPVV